ncbi:MAG: hypothetical protein UZ21_OP11001000061 [Microgenomates bacterium OLB22]|nr:MAG: hypothetical protein UZ21_OP11001000061 [Microgenomates bacterium OLB22]
MGNVNIKEHVYKLTMENISYFIFFCFFRFFFFITNPTSDWTYVPLHDYLFNAYLINIYFFDWTGYFGLWQIIGMLTTLSAVTYLLQSKSEK